MSYKVSCSLSVAAGDVQGAVANFLLGGFTDLLVVAVYSCCLSLPVVVGDVEGAVMIDDSEDAEAVVARNRKCDVLEGASDAVVAGDEADNLEISCGRFDFGLYLFVSVLTFSFLLEA